MFEVNYRDEKRTFKENIFECIKYYLELMTYDKTRENELNESEFVKVWIKNE